MDERRSVWTRIEGPHDGPTAPRYVDDRDELSAYARELAEQRPPEPKPRLTVVPSVDTPPQPPTSAVEAPGPPETPASALVVVERRTRLDIDAIRRWAAGWEAVLGPPRKPNSRSRDGGDD